MLKYFLTRLFQTILVLFIVVTLVFIILRGIGDPARLLISPEGSLEDLAQIQKSLGLDQPLYKQYFDYMFGIFRGDFGKSYYYSQPTIDLIKQHIPATLILACTAAIISVPLAIVTGIVASVKRNSLLDNVVTTLTIAGRSIPTFCLGLLLMLLFSITLKWLPPSGYGGIKELIMPALTLGAGLGASIARMTRASMLDVMKQDYMTTARAKGVSGNRVIVHHGLRNALLPVVTMLTMQIARLFSGSVVVESIFAWPGVGRLMIDAIMHYDYPLVQACALIMALLFAVVNIITDLLYVIIDPRIKFS